MKLLVNHNRQVVDVATQPIRLLAYTSCGTPIAAEQLGFAYDQGWNMTGRAVNGTPTSYTVNDLNAVTAIGGTPCTYDQNGNRITSGQGSGTTQYTYDDENRLIRVSYSTAYRTDFAYDGLGRLRVRTEYSYSGGWNVTSTVRYIYDGKRVIQERNGNNTPLVAYTRGKDLSGSLEGAGGIGGLLARSHGYSGGSWTTHNFYHADGNGNITCMVDTGQNIVASYKYDPYGRTINSSGTLAAANLYRFSSKEFHVNSGLYHYLYRFYDPNTQRWLNRDPKGEPGFQALRSRHGYPSSLGNIFYDFVGNDPENAYDAFGLEKVPDSNIDECLDNCDQDKKDELKRKTKLGGRVLVYVVCTGVAATGGALCCTPGWPLGIALIGAGGAGDVYEWYHNAKEDERIAKEVRANFIKCCTDCGVKYKEPDLARDHIRRTYPDYTPD